MPRPIVVNLPHSLGTEEARRRIAGGMSKLEDYLPRGASVRSSWTGDRLTLSVTAMGQDVTSHIDVEERNVRVEVTLPALLGMFADKIAGFLSRKGGELLEDKRSNKGP